MNSQNHIPKSVVRSAFAVADKMEPLKKKKDPTIAAICGGALGGVGLGIYLESWLDFFVPWCMLLVLLVFAAPTAGMSTVCVPVFWAVYGYRRVKASNEKLEGRQRTGIIEAEIIAEPRPIRADRQITAPTGALQVRMQRLDSLQRQGILSPTEHAEQRAKLLREI